MILAALVNVKGLEYPKALIAGGAKGHWNKPREPRGVSGPSFG